MSMRSSPVTLAMTDTDIWECPATYSGAIRLVISNINAGSRTLTLKFYKQSTAVTTTTVTGFAIAGNSVNKDISVSMEPGDKLIGSASAVSSLVVWPTISVADTSARVGLTPTGVWNSGTTYAKNDVVAKDGTSYLSMAASNLNHDPASNPAWWMVNASKGEQGAVGADGSSALVIVEAAAVGTESLSTDFENNDIIDGVTLATGNKVLRASATNPELNGIYVVQGSGAAVRDTAYNNYNAHCGVYVSVRRGSIFADTLWKCTSDPGGTLNTTALIFVPALEKYVRVDVARSFTAVEMARGRASISAALKGSGIFGLGMTNNASDAINDLDTATGEVPSDDPDYPVLMKLGIPLTKRLDALFDVGNGAGGLDIGTAANATYFRYLIQNFSTGDTDILFSLSPDTKLDCTISIASPGVVTCNDHGLQNGAGVKLFTTGALPTNLTAGTLYYVINRAANTFQLSATQGGSAINTTGSQSGSHRFEAWPKMPTGYDIKKRIYSFLRENLGGDKIVPFTQNKNLFKRNMKSIFYTTGTIPAALTNMGVPVGIITRPILEGYTFTGTTYSEVYIGAGNALSGGTEQGFVAVVANTGSYAFARSNVDHFITNRNGQLYISHTMSGAAPNYSALNVHGWYE